MLAITPLEGYYEDLGLNVKVMYEMHDFVNYNYHDLIAISICSGKSIYVSALTFAVNES